ncbi:MAG: hypothetical protein HYW05_04075 [Candidatus Diapherotrites archaeon]|nr:hypothetical protein [Candidatus Diapherotrites archaeon]
MPSDEQILNAMRGLVGSSGAKGWPVSVRDRIAFPERNETRITNADFAVTFLWTMRDAILPKLEKERLAIASNFYTPAGLEGMARNILANPFIRYMIVLGSEYSAAEQQKTLSPNSPVQQTSANSIRAFFEKGINSGRKLQGFESAVYFDRNIPSEAINGIMASVELIDLNSRMPRASLEEKIAEANRIMKEAERKQPFSDTPQIFPYEPSAEEFPHEGSALLVSGNSIPETWIEIMHAISRYGKRNLMNANTDRRVKEINNLVAVIHSPQNGGLSLNPFLVPLTNEKILAYQKEVLSPLLPEGKAYTYGNKLRAYLVEDAGVVKELANSPAYKDFEFGKGAHLDANVKYLEKGCEIDQIADIIDALKRDPYSKAGVAITWHVSDELMRKHKSSPCLVLLHPIVQDERLNLMVYFRSHDMVQGWPENAYGCAAIQKTIADAIGLPTGIITIISGSAQIYAHYYKQVEEMLSKFRKPKIDYSDPRGNYVIAIEDGKISIALLHPETNREIEKICGASAREIYEQLAFKAQINTSHALYLGAELQKAEFALKRNLEYAQDSELREKK